MLLQSPLGRRRWGILIFLWLVAAVENFIAAAHFPLISLEGEISISAGRTCIHAMPASDHFMVDGWTSRPRPPASP